MRSAYLALMSGAAWHQVTLAIVTVPSRPNVGAWHQPMSIITDRSTISRTCKKAHRFIIRRSRKKMLRKIS